MSQPVYRTATRREVAQMLDWAAEEGWNPGLDDAAAFHAADPEGFFLAEVDGTAAAAISVVNHSADFAFLGLYLCRPEHRGRGIGYALWQHALQHAGARTVGLDGVPAQQANYARSGFVLAGRTLRLTGRLPAVPRALPCAGLEDLPALEALDTQAGGVRRPRFLRAWLTPDETRKSVILRREANIEGFATARLCREGCKIGPIIAPDAEAAWHLAQQAAAAIGTREAMIDVPESAATVANRLCAAGFSESFSTARMYLGAAPVAGANLQAVATLELG